MRNWEKYKYYSTSVKKKKRRLRLILLAVVFAGIAIGAVLVFFSFSEFKPDNEFNLNELWESKNYNEIISICNKFLLDNPLDPYHLIFKGFSCFYKVDSEPENKSDLIEESVISLRKARLSEPEFYDAEIDYILGLSYFNKGRYYYDLSILYCERALSKGFERNDIYKCLGISNGELGYPEKELDYFLKALKNEKTDHLYLSAGKAFRKLNQIKKAEEYVLTALDISNDMNTAKECRFVLGDIYFERDELSRAEEQYLEAIKIDNRSVNAHYRLSEIYAKMGNKVKARAELRETLIIDPSHYDAKLRYYK